MENTKGKGKAQDAEEAKEDEVSGGMEDKEKEGEERRFACRHCHNTRVLSGIGATALEQDASRDTHSPAETTDTASGSGGWGGDDSISKQGGDGGDSTSSPKTPAWMEWNGMRSHLKAKYVPT